jgi:hypothetical protein
MLPDIALGATIAAIIGALASLLGLIISKEQKTSEFRQAWIDGLRDDLTNYATQINVIADVSKVVYKSHEKKVAALREAYSSLNSSNFSINLRLNRNEALSKAVMRCIGEFNELAMTEEGLTSDNLRRVETAFITASQDLLKYEWKRVKRGELSFIVSKYIATAIIVVLPAVLLWYHITREAGSVSSPPAAEPAPRVQSQANVLSPPVTPKHLPPANSQ